MRSWPALDVRGFDDPDLVLALVDEFEPTAAVDGDGGLRLFFNATLQRDAARADLTARHFTVSPVDVPDDDWARRSQQNLAPITVGRITVFPNPRGVIPGSHPLTPAAHAIVIQPSMGFGTGHHATTRLCLRALQATDLAGAFVLDVGTGSGVLAIAAVLLGATRALGIDSDADAIQSANENLSLNPGAHGVAFEITDLTTAALPQADIVTANLTGALLVRAAAPLRAAVRPGGTLIASGMFAGESASVGAAFHDWTSTWAAEEDGWIGLAFRSAHQVERSRQA